MARVLIASSWYPSSNGHPYTGVFVKEQAIALAKYHDVRVVAPNLNWLLRPRRKSSPEADSGLQVQRPDARFFWPRRFAWVHAAEAFSRAIGNSLQEWRLLGWKPDLIHAHTLVPAGWAAIRAGRDTGTPVVITVHTSFGTQAALPRSSARLMREAISDADALIAVGPALAADLRAIQPACHPLVVPNLVDSDFFSPTKPLSATATRSAISVLGIGNLKDDKRFDLLLSAAARVVKSGIPLNVTIIGIGPEQKRLERMAARPELLGRITFAGALDRHAVRDRLRQCDVLVHPSRHETFGVVLIEAMACGKPVIATRSNGAQWTVRPGFGELVDVDDELALAAAIRRFASGETTFDGNLARQSVLERFSPDAVAGEISAVYEQVLGPMKPKTGAGEPSGSRD